MSPALLAAPLFIAFELWQLIIGERYLGIRQIARGGDPREWGPSEPVALLWTGGLILYCAWMGALLFVPPARGYGLLLAAATGIGYTVRRNCGLNRILIVLTFEGAVRIGLLVSLCSLAWRHSA